MSRTARCLFAALCCAALFTHAPAFAQAPAGDFRSLLGRPEHDFARWEKEIAAFEAADRKRPPPKGGVLFIGSSTIKLWKTLAQDFPDHKVINRGFGGSEIVDSTCFAPRIIFPYEPKVIFLRAGGNDIHAGRSVDGVAYDFAQFVAFVHERLPKSEIVYIAVNPAPARWRENDKYQALNKKIREFAVATSRVSFVDAYDVSLTPDGKGRPELFVPDLLHFNAAGYKLLAERVRPFMPTPAYKDPTLRAELIKRMKAEQEVRQELARVAPPNNPAGRDSNDPAVKAMLEKMATIDRDNLAWLKRTVAAKGWPTKSMVGRKGAQGAFLIAQHATSDLEFMNACLGRLKKAYQEGDAEGEWVALMTDRLLVLREKKKQLYGTQLEAKEGRLIPQPIEDEANVDKRRAELGMPPLADYLKMANERSAVAGKPASEKAGKPAAKN